MKRDVTRGGRRTQRGAMDDAVAGARRYFMNNLKDSQKQLRIDLLLGLAGYDTLQDINKNACSDKNNSEDVTNSNTEKINVDKVTNTQRRLFQYAPRVLRLARIKQLLHSKVFAPLIPDATLSATSTNTHSKNTTLPSLPSVRESGAAKDLTSDNVIAEESAPDIMSRSSLVITTKNQSSAMKIIDVNSTIEDASKENVMSPISSIDTLLSEMLHDVSTAETIIAPKFQRVKKVRQVKKEESKQVPKRYQVNYLERVKSHDKPAILPTKRSEVQNWVKRAVNSSYLKLALAFAIALGIISR